MKLYTFIEWLSFFYIYCFLGWIWECCYVSFIKKQWVNRGFLHGPLLPIYGSGAIVILVSTIPVRESIPAVFVFGMIGATLLEFCTGFCMERMFGVRYWDYSNQPLNVKGHICLGVSLGWGFFSVLMVKVIHQPVDKVIGLIPLSALEILVFMISILVAVDFTQSFNEAMDLKSMLEKISSSNEQIRILTKRIEVVAAFAEEDYRKFKETRALRQEEKVKKEKSKWEVFEHNLLEKKEWSMLKFQKLTELAGDYFHKNNIGESIEIRGFLAKLEEEKQKIGARTAEEYKRILRIIKRNPDAISKEHEQELEEIKKMMK